MTNSRIWSRCITTVAAGLVLLTGCQPPGRDEETPEPVPSTTPSTPSPTPRTMEQVIDATTPLVMRIESVSCDGSYSSGSGFLVAPDLVATVAHVVEDARTLSVRSPKNGKGPYVVSRGAVIGIDPEADLALVQLKYDMSRGSKLSFSRAEVQDQDEIVVIGYPLGLSQAAVQGTITATDQDASVASGDGDETLELQGLVRHNADTSGGDSGGPVINSAGEVIGLHESGVKGEALGWAVPADKATRDRFSEWKSSQGDNASTCDPQTDSLLNVTSRHPDAPGIGFTLHSSSRGSPSGRTQAIRMIPAHVAATSWPTRSSRVSSRSSSGASTASSPPTEVVPSSVELRWRPVNIRRRSCPDHRRCW